jgi:hypothetical protein
VAAVTITPDDLAPFAPDIPANKAAAMIEDVMAMAATVAPCITDPDFAHAGAAKAILRGAIIRWNKSDQGALTNSTESVDDYNRSWTFDTRQKRSGLFWPSEIEQLQALCRTTGPAGAFAVDTVGAATPVHADICALRFGAAYCSCGAVLTMNLPLYENLP